MAPRQKTMPRSILSLMAMVIFAVLVLSAGDAAAVCGDGILDPGEGCDPPSACCLAGCTCDAGAGCGVACFTPLTCQQTDGVSDSGCPCNSALCPLAAGEYTVTTIGGSTTVGTAPPVPQALGGSTKLLVGPGDASCVHSVVIPLGGYSIPLTCILGFITTASTQAGCGIGLLDSDGGSDFTITETGDTSSPVACGLPHAACTPGGDASLQLDVTVGDGIVDTCATGTGNLITSIPISTLSWIESDTTCPAFDGTFDPGDTFVSSLALTIDNTTDTSSAGWADLDPDACFLAGVGPASGFSNTGVCLDYAAGTVTMGASAAVGSTIAIAGNDITFTSLAIQTFAPSGPFPSPAPTCLPGPLTPLPGGTVTRCIP